MEPSSVKRRLTCILAADAVGYSEQMGRDEEGTIRVLSAHRAVIDGIIAFHQGRIVSTAGDSVIAEFSSAVDSVRCAVEIQDALKTRNDSLAEHRQMRFRIGVNLGDVVVKNDDLLGDGVNVAARLETMAEPGGICISSSVYDQITGKLDLGFQDIGDQNLKNISPPIHVYRVSGAGIPMRVPSTAPPAPPPVAASRGPIPWAIGAVLAVIIGTAVAWQAGWVRFGSTDMVAKSAAPAVVAAPAPAAVPAPVTSAAPVTAATTNPANAATSVPPSQPDVDAQRLRKDVEAIKRQAENEVARARADVAAARAKMETESAARAAEAQASRTALAERESAAKAREPVVSAPIKAASEPIPPPATGGANRFDGTWNVTVDCAKTADGAFGYVLEFVAQVKDGFLRGEQGTEGAPSFLRIQGSIQPDGSARLDAKGMTGDQKYNANGVQRGIPYAYQVAAQFDGTHGSGRRLQLRPCNLTFVRQ